MKSLIGTMMNKKANLVFFGLLFSLFANADISIPIAGVPLENKNPVESMEVDDSSTPHVPGIEYSNLKFKTKKKTVSLPEEGINSELDEAISKKESLKSWGISLPGTLANNSSYERLSDRDLLSKIQDAGDSSFSLIYISDEYDVSDTSGIYQRTYGDGVPKAMRGGSVHVSFDRFWIHSSVFVGYSMGLGVGLSQGRGSFTSGGVTAEQSTTKFSLWTIPADVGLVLEVPLGSWLKIGISGGPSGMALYQHRDDKENKEGGKHLRQYSWGYYGRANLKFSLSHLTPNQAVRNFRAYNMTKMWLTLEARMQEYANFQDDVSISGNSFGLGFSFEYL